MKIINVLENRLDGERCVLKKWRGQGPKGANGTKNGDCTKVHSECTANLPYIKGQGRERMEGGWGKGQYQYFP